MEPNQDLLILSFLTESIDIPSGCISQEIRDVLTFEKNSLHIAGT